MNQQPYTDASVYAENLTKRYSLYTKPLDRLKEVLARKKGGYHREFTALDKINFMVRRGETLGIIGPNGAGKSTLLKIIAGIIDPTEGRYETHGRISAIIELGAGFHPEFTGRENVVMNATLLGFRASDLGNLMNRVERFSELGKYIDMPLKTYSTGMFMRLAFSIAINVSPDILLIDEALAVGDAVFAHRCMARIRELQQQKVTILFVSHDVNAVMQICDHALYIDKGVIVAQGDPKHVVERYHVSVAERLSSDTAPGTHPVEFFQVGAPEISRDISERRFGTLEARIVDIRILDSAGKEQDKFVAGVDVTCAMKVQFATHIKNPVFGIMVKNRFGVEVFGTNTYLRGEKTGEYNAGNVASVQYKSRLNLCPGVYSLSFAVHTIGGHFYDYRVDARLIEIIQPATAIGIANLPLSLSWKKEAETSPVFNDDFFQKVYGNAPSQLIMDQTASEYLVGEWYLPEQSPDGWYRWMGEEASVYLSVASDAQQLFCEFRTFHPVASADGLRITIKINGKVFDEIRIRDNNWNTFEISLPREITGGIVQITFCPSGTFTPEDDDRRLSVQCRQCGIR